MDVSNNERRLMANMHCYYGELAELKEKQGRGSQEKNESAKKFAAQQYFKAINIYPFIGRYFILLASKRMS